MTELPRLYTSASSTRGTSHHLVLNMTCSLCHITYHTSTALLYPIQNSSLFPVPFSHMYHKWRNRIVWGLYVLDSKNLRWWTKLFFDFEHSWRNICLRSMNFHMQCRGGLLLFVGGLLSSSIRFRFDDYDPSVSRMQVNCSVTKKDTSSALFRVSSIFFLRSNLHHYQNRHRCDQTDADMIMIRFSCLWFCIWCGSWEPSLFSEPREKYIPSARYS